MIVLSHSGNGCPAMPFPVQNSKLHRSTVRAPSSLGMTSRQRPHVIQSIPPRKWIRGICKAAAEVLQEESTASRHPLSSDFQGVPHMWSTLAVEHGEVLAAFDPHHSPATRLTYRELDSQIKLFATGLASLGLKAGDKVALFSENSARWLVADQGIMTLGAADAVRGTTSPADEMAYIIRHSESCAMIVQDSATLERALPALTPPQIINGNGNGALPIHKSLRFVVVLWGEPSEKCMSTLSCPVLSYAQLMARADLQSFTPASIGPDTLATLVYTSGTTGTPKGVELTHSNLDYQKRGLSYYLNVQPGDQTLSLLPPWHIYERSAATYALSRAATQVYTSIRNFREDLTKYPPSHFICVPLVLDTLYNRVRSQITKGSKVKKALANFFLAASTAYVHAKRIVDGVALQYALTPRPFFALVMAVLTSAILYPVHRLGQILVYAKIRQAIGIKDTVISGGGSLAAHLDNFFEVLGLEVLNGWGLTETSPVLACRRALPYQNVRGTVGLPIPGTEVRVVNPETLEPVPDGQQGLLLVKGPGVMRGYYNDQESTTKAMRAGPGWFDTGDLGWRAPSGVAGSRMAGHITLTGRSKDTIVLSNGENIEPQPIEDALCMSPYISHLVLVGQDKRMLGALVAPSMEAFDELEQIKDVYAWEGKLSEEERRAVIRAEMSGTLSSQGLRENIGNFVILNKPLSADDGTLTRTLKPRRPAIFAKYAVELEELLNTLR